MYDKAHLQPTLLKEGTNIVFPEGVATGAWSFVPKPLLVSYLGGL